MDPASISPWKCTPRNLLMSKWTKVGRHKNNMANSPFSHKTKKIYEHKMNKKRQNFWMNIYVHMKLSPGVVISEIPNDDPFNLHKQAYPSSDVLSLLLQPLLAIHTMSERKYLATAPFCHRSLFHLLFRRTGCSPRMCSGMKSCLVKMPTTGDLWKYISPGAYI